MKYATISITNSTDPKWIGPAEAGMRIHVEAIHLENHGDSAKFTLITMQEKTAVPLLPRRTVAADKPCDLKGPIAGTETGEPLGILVDSAKADISGTITLRYSTD